MRPAIDSVQLSQTLHKKMRCGKDARQMGQSNLIDEASSGGKEQLVCQRLSQPNDTLTCRRAGSRGHCRAVKPAGQVQRLVRRYQNSYANPNARARKPIAPNAAWITTPIQVLRRRRTMQRRINAIGAVAN